MTKALRASLPLQPERPGSPSQQHPHLAAPSPQKQSAKGFCKPVESRDSERSGRRTVTGSEACDRSASRRASTSSFDPSTMKLPRVSLQFPLFPLSSDVDHTPDTSSQHAAKLPTTPPRTAQYDFLNKLYRKTVEKQSRNNAQDVLAQAASAPGSSGAAQECPTQDCSPLDDMLQELLRQAGAAGWSEEDLLEFLADATTDHDLAPRRVFRKTPYRRWSV
jgi:hypothetical protein